MSVVRNWDDESREGLRATLKWVILGALRLAKHDRATILEICRDVYIHEACPIAEVTAFTRFAAEEFDRAVALHEAEMENWPAITDCDRLDRVEDELRDRGILLWQMSPCCDTCTRGELATRLEVLEKGCPGFSNRCRGYSFFIDQNMADSLSEETSLSVYLGYGWFAPDDFDFEANAAEYERNALIIAHEVCDCFREEGFEADWTGNLDRKIGITLNWQRRDLLS